MMIIDWPSSENPITVKLLKAMQATKKISYFVVRQTI